ncbi:hypothetical protein [Poriferisphaera sp. WC338]|uniref:hypothetical protein n=1 Tax=Poriferisphaera sp. WC338 TaxID=3425129 RepID=UPI003D816556
MKASHVERVGLVMIDENVLMHEEKESRWPLVIGVVYAVLVHALAWPLLGWGLGGSDDRVAEKLQEVAHEERMKERDDEVFVGRDEDGVPQVSWISYDDLRELMAPKSEVEQPAQQSEVDPVKEAPLVMDATDAAPMQEASEPQMPSGELVEREEVSDELARQEYELLTNAEGEDIDVTVTEAGEAEEQTEQAKELTQGANSDQASAAAEQVISNPTSAPRTEAESDAATLMIEDVKLVPGMTVAIGDIEVKTKRPRFSVQAYLTSLRTVPDPVVMVKFDQEGKVVDVKFLRKSGAANVDRPVETSLYGWRASGKGLKKHKHVVMEVTMILRGPRPRK